MPQDEGNDVAPHVSQRGNDGSVATSVLRLHRSIQCHDNTSFQFSVILTFIMDEFHDCFCFSAITLMI